MSQFGKAGHQGAAEQGASNSGCLTILAGKARARAATSGGVPAGLEEPLPSSPLAASRRL